MTRARWFRVGLVLVGVTAVLAVGFGLGRYSAGGGEGAAADQQLWHCPMHSDYVSEEPGACPICGMDLVPIEDEQAGAATVQDAASPHQMWTCPMHPDYVSEQPGSCPICGMDLVPVERDQGGGGDDQASVVEGLSSVHLTEAKRQLTGVTTVATQIRELSSDVRTVGIVRPDETTMRTVNAKVGGWVERLYIDFAGAEIEAGQPMLTIYSPQLYQTQREYVAALKARRRLSASEFAEVSRVGEQMVAAAEQRLRLWDIPQADIERLRHGGSPQRAMTLYAPVTGVVTQRLVEAGAEIKPGTPLLHVVDLSSVWVEADVFEQDLDRVEEGQIATVTFEAFPGERWQGGVQYVYPWLEGETRSMKARIPLRNPGRKLKPEMYGQVQIKGSPEQVLAVPEEAVIDTGERQVVYVATQEGVYEPREVRVGRTSDGWIEILDGLEEGRQVVERGLFMIDSESRLRAAVSSSSGHDQ
ncbi:MAG: efflux RND transporter periplasmic adaptor subunit [Armatimonadota bacterium]